MTINDIDQKDKSPELAKDGVRVGAPASVTPSGDELALSHLVASLNIEPKDIKDAEQSLCNILSYLKSEHKDLSPENIDWIISDLQARLGTPPFGVKWADHLSKYAFLVTEKARVEEELKEVVKHGSL